MAAFLLEEPDGSVELVDVETGDGAIATRASAEGEVASLPTGGGH